MRVLYTFPFAALAIVVACSSSENATPTPNDGGTAADGSISSDDPCEVPFQPGQNFIGNEKFKSNVTRTNADRDLQWQLQGYNDLLMKLQELVGGSKTMFERMYPACKKLAEDLGATGNEIARAADEPTDDLKLRKTCAVALQYIKSTYDEFSNPPRHVQPITCVSRISDADACMKAYGASVANAKCRSAVDANVETPLNNGECKDGWLDPGAPCSAPLVKMVCGDGNGVEAKPIYVGATPAPGKRNQEVIEFMTAHPFFFPWNNEVRTTRADIYEQYFSRQMQQLEFGPTNIRPTCGQKLNQKIALIVGPFLEAQAFAKELRATIGLPTP